MNRAVPFRLAALLAACGALAARPARAQTVVVGPRSPAIAVAPGGFVTVPIVADLTGAGGASLGSATGQLSYDQTRMRLVSSAPGTAGSVVFNPDTVNGTLRFAVASAAGSTGFPTLANAVFQVTGTVGDSAQLGVSLSEVTAASTFANLLPITVTTGAHVCFAVAGRFGDVDGNDTLKSNDALIIITHAVGLPIAPYTVSNGDADGDGKVDSRDALLVLSYVVGLPTTPYRVGQVTSGSCGSGAVASVQVGPASNALAVGDVVPLVATPMDSLGRPTHASLVWVSRDTTVAKATPARVQAVAPGTTRVLVVAGPGLQDSVTVTVSGARRMWFVDPVIAAANNGTETGSTQYPFGTINGAVNAAAAGDTVRVAVATYTGGIQVAKPLTILGDSNASGVPVIAPLSGAGVDIGAVGAGRLTLRSFHINGAPGGGVNAYGTGADSVLLDGVSVDGSANAGVSVRRLARFEMRGATVRGVTGVGIGADSVQTAVLHGLTVDALGSAGQGPPLTLHVRHTDSLAADSLALTLGSVRLDSVRSSRLARATIRQTPGTLLEVLKATDLTLDTVDVSDGFGPGGPGASGPFLQSAVQIAATGRVTLRSLTVQHVNGPALLVSSAKRLTMRDGLLAGPMYAPGLYALRATADTMAIAQLEVNDGDVLLEGCGTCAGSATIDTLNFSYSRLIVRHQPSVLVRGGFLYGIDTTLVRVDSSTVVTLRGLEVTGAAAVYSALTGGSYAVTVQHADSVAIDSLWIHHNSASALWVDLTRVVRLYGNLFENNHIATPPSPATDVRFDRFRSLRVAQTVIDLGPVVVATAGLNLVALRPFLSGAPGVRVDVDSSTFKGGLGIYADAASRQRNDTLSVRALRAVPTQGVRNNVSLVAMSIGRVQITGMVVDSVLRNTNALSIQFANSFDIQNSSFTHIGRGIVAQADSGFATVVGPGVFSSNVVDCDTTFAVAGIYTVTALGSPLTVTNNSFPGGQCGLGLVGVNRGAMANGTVIRDNTASIALGAVGYSLQGPFRSAVVARNLVHPGTILISVTVGQSVDSLRLDSNEVSQGNVRGIQLLNTMNALTARGNVVDTVFGSGGINFTVPAGSPARLIANTIRKASPAGVIVSGDTLYLDSNVIVESPIGLRLANNTRVVGRRNFLARNDTAITSISGGSFVRMDTSTIQQSTTARGARNTGAVTWQLANNYWGDALGPRCTSGCNPASLGDSIIGPASFATFLAAPPATPVGAPPAFRPGGAASALRTMGAAGATRVVSPRPHASGKARPASVPRVLAAPTSAGELVLPTLVLPRVDW